jgi:hypothetical protein
MSELVIDVPLAELPPSPNRSKGVHWAVRSRANKTARDMAYAYGWNFRTHRPDFTSVAQCQQKRSCRIEIIYPTSRRGPMTDPDSALARLKPLIDGLVDAGCLRGDGPADVSYEPIQQRKEGKQLLVRFTLLSSPGTSQKETT